MRFLVKFLCAKYGADQVTVITGRPNFPDGNLLPENKFKLFRTYTGEFGQKVINLYEIPAVNKGFFKRIMSYASFAASVFLYFIFKRMRKGDIVFVTSGPIFASYAISVLQLLKRRFSYIIDVRDLWPQTIAGMGMLKEGKPIYNFLKMYSDFAYKNAVQAVGNVDGIRNYLNEVRSSDSAKSTKNSDSAEAQLIYNPVDTQVFTPMSVEERIAIRKVQPWFAGEEITYIVYSGIHASYIDLMTLLRSCLILKEADNLNFRILVAGFGDSTEELKSFVEENDLSDLVQFLGQLSRQEVRNVICLADFGYSSCSAEPIFKMVVATKMTEYMSCNRFTVCVQEGPFPEKVEAEGHALVIEPEQPELLAEKLAALMTKKSEYTPYINSRGYIEANHSVEAFERRYDNLFKEHFKLSAF